MASYFRLYPAQAETAEGQHQVPSTPSSSTFNSTSSSSFPDVEKGKEGTFAAVPVPPPSSSSSVSQEVRRRRLIGLVLSVFFFFFFSLLLLYFLSFFFLPFPLNQSYIRSTSRIPFPLSSPSSSHLLLSPLIGFPVFISTSTSSSSFAPVFTQCFNSACTRSKSEVIRTRGENEIEVETQRQIGRGCGVKYTMEMDREGKTWIMKTGSKKGRNEIQVLRYNPQARDDLNQVQSFIIASSPSPASPSNSSSILFYPHSIHLNSNDEPIFVYSRVTLSQEGEEEGTEHRVVIATCEGKDCQNQIKTVEELIQKEEEEEEEEVKPMLSSAINKENDQIFFAVISSPSSSSLSIYSCSSSCSLTSTSGFFLSRSSSSKDEFHSLQLRIEASTSSPVVLYATTSDDEKEGEEEMYAIGLMRDGRDDTIAVRKGDLRSVSFVLDPETEFPILLASAALSADFDQHHHSIIRSCSSLYCDEDDTHDWIITLPKTFGEVSGLEIAENAKHGQLMLLGKVRGQEKEAGHVMMRVDVLRKFNRHVIDQETEEEIVIE